METPKSLTYKIRSYSATFKLEAVSDAALTNNSVSARKHGVEEEETE